MVLVIGSWIAACLLITGGDFSAGFELGSPASQSARNGATAAQRILEHPDSAQPMQYITVVQHFWERGDRAQAAFWYYLWQIRTRPWARADSHSIGPLRGSFTEMWGRPVNEWIGSDPDARTELVKRAISYEASLPLSTERPSGMTAERWEALVISERQSYAAEFDRYILSRPTQAEETRTARRENGLYVGPWQDPGTPLLDHWR